MDLRYYHELLFQHERLEAFRRAIHRVVRPGDRVLEVGAGLGTYALFAAEAGASKVYAVDGDPVIHVAADLARANGLADRVECRRGWVPEVRPPEPVDVVVYEDFGAALVDPRTWRLYRDLQAHCVHADTRWIPGRAHVRVALAMVENLTTLPSPSAHGIRWDPLEEYLVNLPRAGWRGRDTLVSEPAHALTLAFHDPVAAWPTSTDVQAVATVAGHANALALWHVLELAEGIALDNAPGAAGASWGHLVLPLASPVVVRPGAAVAVALRWTPAHDGAPSWLGWSVTQDGMTVGGNTFAGFAASREDIRRGAPDFRPQPGPGTAFALDVLALTDGRRTAREIATTLGTRYPAFSNATLTERVLRVLHAAHAGAEAAVEVR